MTGRPARGLVAVPLAICLPLTCLPLVASLAQDTPAPTPFERGNDAPEIVPGPATGATLTSQWRAGRLIGTTMANMLGESVGRVEDVVIDGDGKVVAVLVGVGGFLGLGETSVAIGFQHLVISQSDADHPEVKTSLSRKAIEQAASLGPDYDRAIAP